MIVPVLVLTLAVWIAALFLWSYWDLLVYYREKRKLRARASVGNYFRFREAIQYLAAQMDAPCPVIEQVIGPRGEFGVRVGDEFISERELAAIFRDRHWFTQVMGKIQENMREQGFREPEGANQEAGEGGTGTRPGAGDDLGSPGA